MKPCALQQYPRDHNYRPEWGKAGSGGSLVEWGEAHQLKVGTQYKAGNSKASERALGISLLVPALSLFRGQWERMWDQGGGWRGGECHQARVH